MANHFCMDPPYSSQAPDHLWHRTDSSQQPQHGLFRGLLSIVQAPRIVAFPGFACAIGWSTESLRKSANGDELFIELQSHCDLVNPPLNFSVQDETNE
jgi:hypothetical protein